MKAVLKGITKGMKFLVIFFVLILAGYIFVNNYEFIFRRVVVGQIVEVKQIDTNIALMQVTGGQDKLNPQMYSAYAVAIREKSGEIVTASAEDRQWAVAKPGNCAEATFYPYPPWNLTKANTYHGARLDKLMEVCQGAQ